MNKRTGQVLVLSALCLSAHPNFALADALVRTQAMKATTIAEFFIEGETLRAELEIGAADIPAFANLLPDEVYQKLGNPPRPSDERLDIFFSEDLIVRADSGQPLIGQLADMEAGPRVRRDEVTGEPVPNPEGEPVEQVLTVRIDYALSGKPAKLSIEPPGAPQGEGGPASIGFVVYHEGVAVNDFRYLGAEETLELDWEDPWYSSFHNRNLKRQFSDPAQGFIYVEPFEVRKEILIRPKDLQNWIDLGLEGKQVIPFGDHATLKQKVADFLGGRCPMTVDGKPAEFEFDRIHFVRRSLRKTSVIDEPVDLPLVSAMLGVIYVHRRDGLPEEAAMTWDLFNDKITAVAGATHDQAGPFPWTVTPDDPVLKWTNFLKNPTLPTFVDLIPPPEPAQIRLPVISVGLAAVAILGLVALRRQKNPAPRWARAALPLSLVGALVLWPLVTLPIRKPFAKSAVISGDEATELTTDLLRNVYRAFDYRDEEVIYDGLARSVSGELLTDIYVQVYKALVMQGQGGAKVKIDGLEMLECETTNFTDRVGFKARCRWNITGKVNHWGHVHTRTNQYEAEFSVEAIDGSAWRITTQQFLGTSRVK